MDRTFARRLCVTLIVILSLGALTGCSTNGSSSEPGDGATTSDGSRPDASVGTDGGGGGTTDAGFIVVEVDGSILVTGTVRDFRFQKPIDFENPSFSAPPDSTKDDPGIVQEQLGADGKPVYAKTDAGTLTTSGPANFDFWYHDAAGINDKKDLTIALTKLDPSSDIYTYDNQEFFPIDNQLFGNEQLPGHPQLQHNYSFTYELHTVFSYRGGETFKFTGDDDLWVFVNKKRVIDLGGIHGHETGSVDLDKLGLERGHTYPLDLFFAERHVTGSHFRIDTSLVLATPPPQFN